MKPDLQKTHHNTDPEQEQFLHEFQQLLSRQLDPDSIDMYADDALMSLIALVQRVEHSYAQQHTGSIHSKQLEDAAFSAYGIEGVTVALDHIAKISDHIHKLDVIVSARPNTPNTIVPSDPDVATIVKGGVGKYTEKKTIARTKTLLFILGETFGVDVFDDNQLLKHTGVLHNTVRKTSYTLLEVEPLERSILICDEEGNRTYIFDTRRLAVIGFDPKTLRHFTKTKLKELIHEYPECGKSFNFSKHFVHKVIAAIENPLTILHEVDGDQGFPIDDSLKTLDAVNFLDPSSRKHLFSGMSCDEIILRAKSFSPDVPLTYVAISSLNWQGLFPSNSTVIKRFGSIRAFHEACGFEVRELAKLTNEELVALAQELSPDEPLTGKKINELSLEGAFLSKNTIADRFGGLVAFQEACGFEVRPFKEMTNEELIELAKKLSPATRLTRVEIDNLSKQGLFPTYETIRNIFGGMRSFQEACGFEVRPFKEMTNEELIELAKKLSPDKGITKDTMRELSINGDFVSPTTIRRRFGSMEAFQKACGFEVRELAKLTNEELVALAQELSPGKVLSYLRIGLLSKDGAFVSPPTIVSRFGSIKAFQIACGY